LRRFSTFPGLLPPYQLVSNTAPENAQGWTMSGHSIYKPQSSLIQWLERRLPVASLVYSSFIV